MQLAPFVPAVQSAVAVTVAEMGLQVIHQALFDQAGGQAFNPAASRAGEKTWELPNIQGAPVQTPALIIRTPRRRTPHL